MTRRDDQYDVGGRDWDYIPALDGLRALAIIAVILFHAGVPGADGGFLGVDLFFVLSGWLITSLLLREARSTGGVDLVAFWGRRMRRLLPAVLVMIVVVVVWAWAAGAPSEGWAVFGDAPWAQFYVANWHEIATSGDYWASFEAPAPLDHLWSLAIEEQFYVVWPLVVLVIVRWLRRGENTVLLVCLCGVAGSFVALRAVFEPTEPLRAYMGTDTRASAILLGAALATSPARRAAAAVARSCRRLIDPLMAAIVTVLVLFWIDAGADSVSGLLSGGVLVHSSLSAVLVLFAVTARESRCSALLGHRLLRWIGQRSYGLYLWHWPIFVWLTSERTGLDGVMLFGVRVAVTLSVAELSYGLVEGPVRWRARWARGTDGWVALFGSMAAVAVFVAAVPRPPAATAAPDDLGELVGTGVSVPASPTTFAPPPTGPPPALQTVAATVPTTAVPPSTMRSTTTSVRHAVAPDRPATKRSAPTKPRHTTTTPASTTTSPVTTTTVAPTTTLWANPPHIDSALLVGDSVAYDLAPGVGAALDAAGLEVRSAAYFGASLTGDTWMPDGQTWLADRYPHVLANAAGDIVLYELSRWDLGRPVDVVTNAHRMFVEMALQHHPFVAFLTAPPMEDRSEDAAWAELERVARAVAAEYPGQVLVIDSSEAWGPTYQRFDRDGLPLRKPDGVHVCPLGAARFGLFLSYELDRLFDGVSPVDASEWSTEWWGDRRYEEPPGGCVPQ